ncbi:MAG TPA: PilN domain-containing protein [Arenicellales bacterium]|nr:PilN domain-containing protein [Arenicellales bacterium]
MATRINLLPWRELRRQEQDRQLLSASIGAWLLMGLVVFYGWYYMNGLIDHQNKRNDYLKTEIAKLDRKIAEINKIKERKQALIARMEIIQQLQQDRTQIVHVFDDLVRKLPKGVYLTGLAKKANRITLKGIAQSNARVSGLMNNLDSSDWFTNPNLDIVNAQNQGGERVSQFTVRVNEQKATVADAGNPGGGS